MNIIPNKPLYEVLFSRESTAFNGGDFVYTEDVLGSNPGSPTNKIKYLWLFYEESARFTEPFRGAFRMRDMFGNEVTVDEARKLLKARTKPQKRGYAAPPGTGPAGETCGTCRHLYRNRMAKTYLKCNLMRAHWTGGFGTDILAKAPACREWTSTAPV